MIYKGLRGEGREGGSDREHTTFENETGCARGGADGGGPASLCFLHLHQHSHFDFELHQIRASFLSILLLLLVSFVVDSCSHCVCVCCSPSTSAFGERLFRLDSIDDLDSSGGKH